MANIGSLAVQLQANGGGQFASTLRGAAGEVGDFAKTASRSANSVLDFGGFMGTASKGVMLLKGVLGGFGIGLAGETIPLLVKGARALFGYSEAAEKAAESVQSLIDKQSEQLEKLSGDDVGKRRAELQKLLQESQATEGEQHEAHARLATIEREIALAKERNERQKDLTKLLAEAAEAEAKAVDKRTDAQRLLDKAAELGATKQQLADLELSQERLAHAKAEAEAQKSLREEVEKRQEAEFKAQTAEAHKLLEDLAAAKKHAREKMLADKPPELAAQASFGSSEALQRVAEADNQSRAATNDILRDQLIELGNAVRALNDLNAKFGAPQEKVPESVVDY